MRIIITVWNRQIPIPIPQGLNSIPIPIPSSDFSLQFNSDSNSIIPENPWNPIPIPIPEPELHIIAMN